MKKYFSQIALGLVCVLLGFMISYQFKLYYNPQAKLKSRSFEDLTKEIEQLRKQRDELSKNVTELQDKIDVYEKNTANSSEAANKMKDELDDLRKLAGLTDVEGPGVIITLTPPMDVTSTVPYAINSSSILDVINELNASGAEAISINDERFVSRTQIREAGAPIIINGTSFSPNKSFVIKAIGDSKTLEAAFNLPGGIKDKLKEEYGITMSISQEQKVKILKYNKYIEYKYIKKAR